MTVAFRPACAVSAADAADGAAIRNISFVATSTTRRMMADLGLIWQARPGGFQIYGQYLGGVGGERRAPLTGDATLTFGIVMKDEALRRYMPALTPKSGPSLYLSNRTAAGAVRAQGALTVGAEVAVADAARIVGRVFLARADLAAQPRPTAISVATAVAPLRTLPDVPITAEVGEVQVPIDLRGAPERVFTIAAKPPGSAKTRVVVDDEFAARPVAGLLDLVLRPVAGPDPAAGRFFSAKFRRRP